MKEQWKDIPEYEGIYQVSNLGRIKSIKRTTTKGGILKLHMNKHNGYIYARLCKNNKPRKTVQENSRLILPTVS